MVVEGRHSDGVGRWAVVLEEQPLQGSETVRIERFLLEKCKSVEKRLRAPRYEVVVLDGEVQCDAGSHLPILCHFRLWSSHSACMNQASPD